MQRTIQQHQHAKAEISRHFKWAIQQIDEPEVDERNDFGRQLDYVDDAIDGPEVMVSVRPRRMF